MPANAACIPAAEYLARAARGWAAESVEARSRLVVAGRTNPTLLQRAGQFLSDISDGIIIPEAFFRKYERLAPLWSGFVKANEALKRSMAGSLHSVLEEARDLGVKRGSAESTGVYLTLMNIEKPNLKLSNSALRARMKAFGEGTLSGDGFLMAQRMRDMTPADLASYRAMVKDTESLLKDKHLDLARMMSSEMDFARSQHRKALIRQFESEGLSGAELLKKVDDYMGDDLPAYISAIRRTMRLTSPNLKAAAADPMIRSFAEEEISLLDQHFGVPKLREEALANTIADLSEFIAANGRDAAGYAWKDAEGIGLKEQQFERADEAVRTLFNLPAGDAGKDDLDQLIGKMRSIGAQPRKGSAIGYLEMIPEKIAVRFYRHRVLSNAPLVGDAIGAYQAYMTSVLRATHLNPLLPEFTKASRDARQLYGNDVANGFISIINDSMGHQSRITSAARYEIAGLARLSYMATLVGNFSGAVSDYLGQMGFILAEHGFRPTLTAIHALTMPKSIVGRKYFPLIDLMNMERVGLESLPKGETNLPLSERMSKLFTAPDLGTFVRRLKSFAINEADVFAGAEAHLHRTAFLASMIGHLEQSGVWKPGMNEIQLKAALDAAMQNPEFRTAFAVAGDLGKSKSAFLFGQVNMPLIVRKVKQLPGGVGDAVTMFSNYPVQSMARLAIWTHDAMRASTDIANGRMPSAQSREAAMKLFRFFTYGSMVAGPFFLWPALRAYYSGGDEETGTHLKNLFVEWEKRYSFAGLIGTLMEKTTGEYETLDLAEKISPMPSVTEPYGPLGSVGQGPLVQLAQNLYTSKFGLSTSAEGSKAREALVGGAVENWATGLGNPSKPFPTAGLATTIPGGVAMARFLNSLFASGVIGGDEPFQYDRYGHVVNPTSKSIELIRQFGRPLGEVIQAAEGDVAADEADRRTFNSERIKKAALEGRSELVGEILAEDPTLAETIQASDLKRLALQRNLVPQARAMLTSAEPLMLKAFRRAANRLQQGSLSPAEEFALKQQIAVGMMRIKRIQEERQRQEGSLGLGRQPRLGSL